MQILFIVEDIECVNVSRCIIASISCQLPFSDWPPLLFTCFARKGSAKNSTTDAGKINRLTNKGVFFLLTIAYQVLGLHMLAENVDTPTYIPILWLLSASFLIMLLYNLLPVNKRLIVEPYLPMIQLCLCIPIQYLDVSGDNLFLSIIAGFGAINHASLSRAKIYGIGALGTYLLGGTARTIHLSGSKETADLIRYFFVNTLVVLLALIAFYTLKKQMITSIMLESALHTVNRQSEKLKSLAVVEERNRIAAEMHDTVGHTLTAAVLTLEAAEGLVSETNAAQKLRQGIEQVRRGLSELRASVKIVRAGNETDFASVLEGLLQEIRSDTGLDIHLVMESRLYCLLFKRHTALGDKGMYNQRHSARACFLCGYLLLRIRTAGWLLRITVERMM